MVKKSNILMEYAIEREMNKDISDSHENNNGKSKPSVFGDFPHTEEELKKMLGRKWLKNLALLGSFFDEYQHLTHNYLKYQYSSCEPIILEERMMREMGECSDIHTYVPTFEKDADDECYATNLSLSSRSKNLLSIYAGKERSHKGKNGGKAKGSKKAPNETNVRRVLKLLMKVKGIVCTDSRYWHSKRGGKCRTYAYNKEMEKLVLSLVKKYDINLTHAKPMVMNLENDVESDKDFNIRISSKLRVAGCTDEMCKSILAKKYGELLAPRLLKVIEMNETLPRQERINFDWNISRSEKDFITKIGIRATSQIVALKAHENENESYSGLWRRDYLNQKYGMENWFEYDVKGSIYNITHLLNKGNWYGNSHDPYAQMYSDKFDDAAQRTAYKSLCMCLYFDSLNAIVHHNKKRTPETLKLYKKFKVEDALRRAEKKMVAFTGTKLDSEIFLHESLLYIDFVYQLRKMGIEVVQIYDGFYFKSGSISKAELEELMKKTALNYYSDYQEWLGNKPTPDEDEKPDCIGNGERFVYPEYRIAAQKHKKENLK